MINKVQKVTIKGLIHKNGKVFMLKDIKGNWELPGGRVRFGENVHDCLQREFKEELGIKNITVKNVINVWSFISTNNENCQFIVIVYKCIANLNKIKISKEHLDFEWIDMKKISNYQMKNGYFETLKKILD